MQAFVQFVAFQCFHFLPVNGGAAIQPGKGNAAIFIGRKDADFPFLAVQQTELDAFHGFSGFCVHLEQIQYRIWLVLVFDNSGLASLDFHIDRVGVQLVPLPGFGFLDHNPLGRQIRNNDAAC